MLLRYRIKPLSPIITPLMSDTFFGHFCWAMRYQKGESFLTDFLSSYGSKEGAPVLFSSAIISGYLPRPVLPPPKRAQIRSFIEKYFVKNPHGHLKDMTDRQKRFQGMESVKSWNKLRLIAIDEWTSLKDDYSEMRVMDIFYQRLKTHTDGENRFFEAEVTAANTISRSSGAVLSEGGFFPREKTWYHKNVELELYVEINSQELSPVVDWFLTDYLPLNGFGKDKSVGMGCMEIARDDTFDPGVFKVKDANALLSLSLAAFEGMEKDKPFYNLITKFGKLGGAFAFSSPSGGAPRPFKKPILMFEPGAVFFTKEHLNTKPLIGNVHSDKRIRQCGIPVTLPFRTREDNSNVQD